MLFKKKIDPPGVFDQIIKFKDLKNGWDGYGSKPIPKQSIFNAIHLYTQILLDRDIEECPRVSASAHGSICFSWGGKAPSKRLELEVHPNHEAFEYFYRNSYGEVAFDYHVKDPGTLITMVGKYFDDDYLLNA